MEFEDKIYLCQCHDCALVISFIEIDNNDKEVEFQFMKSTNSDYKQGWWKRIKFIFKYLRTGRLEGPVVCLNRKNSEDVSIKIKEFLDEKITD